MSERDIANSLRSEIIKKPTIIPKDNNVKEVKAEEKSYISPIMSMNEDEMVDFVEDLSDRELASLSFAELDKIQEVLGIDPKEFMDGKD